MSGLGAWSFGYYQRHMVIQAPRQAWGLKMFKQVLIDLGYGRGIDLNLPEFGHAMDTGVRSFQTAHASELLADGVIGPATARCLFRFYASAAELGGTIEIPDHLLLRLGGRESGHDPVAQGYYDPDDEGWAQINGPSHPALTIYQRWTPSFAIPWAGSYLKKFYVNYEADWDGALASYNVGIYTARVWVQSGKPASGGPVVNGVDLYTRCTTYVTKVKQQPA